MENITLFGIFFLQCLMLLLKHFIPDSFQSCQTRPFWAISSVCQIFHRCKFLVLVNGLVVQRWEFFDLFIELVKERVAKSQPSFSQFFLQIWPILCRQNLPPIPVFRQNTCFKKLRKSGKQTVVSLIPPRKQRNFFPDFCPNYWSKMG